MPGEIRFHLDENIDPAVAAALRSRGIDVTLTQGADLCGCEDAAQREHALRTGRVLVTHDEDFLRLHAAGLEHAGIAYCPAGRRTIGQIARSLRLIYLNRASGDLVRRLEFI